MEDPYQYDHADTEWLGRRIEALEIKRRWRALDEAEKRELKLLAQAVRRREELDAIVRSFQ